MDDMSQPWESIFSDIEVTRAQVDPPDEGYEQAWLEAQRFLKEAGKDAGFIILIATPLEDGDLDTNFIISSGAKKIDNDMLAGAMLLWLEHQNAITKSWWEQNDYEE